jgi:putative component of toxin-antitoxin plasmid stabilization module
MQKIDVIKTKTYLDSVYGLKNNSDIVAIEKKVNKLLTNPNIAKPMKHQHEGFCEIKVGEKNRVYCIKLDHTIIVFVMGIVDTHHGRTYQKPKEYEKLFKKLREVKEKFKVNN